MLCVLTLASVFVTYFYLFLLCYFSLHFASSLPFACSSYKEQYWPRKRFHWRKISSYIIKTRRKIENIFIHEKNRKEKRRKRWRENGKENFPFFKDVDDNGDILCRWIYSLVKFSVKKGGDHFHQSHERFRELENTKSRKAFILRPTGEFHLKTLKDYKIPVRFVVDKIPFCSLRSPSK